MTIFHYLFPTSISYNSFGDVLGDALAKSRKTAGNGELWQDSFLNASRIKSVGKGDIDMSVDNGMLTLSNVPENESVSVYSATVSCSARAGATSASMHKAHRWSS